MRHSDSSSIPHCCCGLALRCSVLSVVSSWLVYMRRCLMAAPCSVSCQFPCHKPSVSTETTLSDWELVAPCSGVEFTQGTHWCATGIGHTDPDRTHTINMCSRYLCHAFVMCLCCGGECWWSIAGMSMAVCHRFQVSTSTIDGCVFGVMLVS